MKEQYRDEKIAALTTKHQLTGNQEMVSPVTLMVGIADRETHRTNEMLTQIEAHLEHFIKVYGIEKE